MIPPWMHVVPPEKPFQGLKGEDKMKAIPGDHRECIADGIGKLHFRMHP
jgi:hypothetical protein